jgi:Ca-activated chloride channel homolog
MRRAVSLRLSHSLLLSLLSSSLVIVAACALPVAEMAVPASVDAKRTAAAAAAPADESFAETMESPAPDARPASPPVSPSAPPVAQRAPEPAPAPEKMRATPLATALAGGMTGATDDLGFDGQARPPARLSAKLSVQGRPEDRRLSIAAEDPVFEGLHPTCPARPERINGLVDPRSDRLSTFAVDVDTGSYTLARRFLERGVLPNAGVVRVEEWVNAFHYSYPDAAGKHPFSIHMEAAPLAKQTYVLRIGVQGKRVPKAERDPIHLTFLVDVSGSMSGRDRLPLAKESLKLLVNELGAKDSVSIVTYAGSTAIVLPATATTAANKRMVVEAIDSLRTGGGTNMGSGMELAYREAGKALSKKGRSRVIVLSDGDANIGRVGPRDILSSIKGYVSEGVTMSTVGFGTGNYRDEMMEQLANAGDGNYSYVGSLKDARRIFVDDLTGTLQVIAKDVKIQVEMNPAMVASYRLVGYENRDIADRDFRNDKVDAGEIGAGHTVTALYEVTLKSDEPAADIATVRVRYKAPRGVVATEVARAFPASAVRHDVNEMSVDGRFAVGVGLAAEIFRHSPHADRLGITLADAHQLMVSGATGPHAAERRELVRLLAPFVGGAPVAHR